MKFFGSYRAMNEIRISGLVIIITIIKFVHKDYQNPSIIIDNEQ